MGAGCRVPKRGGTKEVSPYPVRPGTTYLDVEPAGERSGPVVVHVFRKENVRILEELKRYVEAQSRPRSLGTKGAPNALGNDMSHNSKEESNG